MIDGALDSFSSGRSPSRVPRGMLPPTELLAVRAPQSHSKAHSDNQHGAASQLPFPMATAAPLLTAARPDNRCIRRAVDPHLGGPLAAPALGFSLQRRRSGRLCSVAPVSAAPASSESTPAIISGLTSPLERVEVFNLNGKAVPIINLWKERKAVVAFARHFGCVLCRKRADLLASKKELMDAAGVALVLIGPGSVDQAKAFSEQTKFKGEVYADPSHSSYEALKFAYGVSVTFTPSAGMKIVQSYLEGYRQDWGLSFKRDTVRKGGWQQGGILVAGPGVSNISYIHKDKEAGDDPDIEDVVRACCI